MSQPSLNAPGIMAAPQAAEALAAQDVMGAEPRRMASGGMVSFAEGGDIKYDDRGVARFQNQGFVTTFEAQDAIRKERERKERELRDRLPNLFESFKDWSARQEAAAEEIKGRGKPAPSQADVRRVDNFIDATIPPVVAPPVAPPVASGGGRGGGGGGKGGAGGGDAGSKAAPYTFDIPAYSSRFEDQTRAAREALLAQQPLTEEPESAARARGRSEYQAQVPYRMGFLEQDIAKRQKDIEGRRSSNINEALIQSGLGIMRSKSPYFMQAVGEGGTEGLNAYRQGLKDIREGERDILQSRVSLANAQSLYDQGKFAAGDRERESAIARQQRGFDKASSVFATFAKEKTMEIEQYRADVERRKTIEEGRQRDFQLRMEQEKLPAQIAALKAQAAQALAFANYKGGAGRISDADQKLAQDYAIRTAPLVAPKGMRMDSPEYQELVNRLYHEKIRDIAISQGGSYTPPVSGVGTGGGNAQFIGIKPEPVK
jgi:hypothetical protein